MPTCAGETASLVSFDLNRGDDDDDDDFVSRVLKRLKVEPQDDDSDDDCCVVSHADEPVPVWHDNDHLCYDSGDESLDGDFIVADGDIDLLETPEPEPEEEEAVYIKDESDLSEESGEESSYDNNTEESDEDHEAAVDPSSESDTDLMAAIIHRRRSRLPRETTSEWVGMKGISTEFTVIDEYGEERTVEVTSRFKQVLGLTGNVRAEYDARRRYHRRKVEARKREVEANVTKAAETRRWMEKLAEREKSWGFAEPPRRSRKCAYTVHNKKASSRPRAKATFHPTVKRWCRSIKQEEREKESDSDADEPMVKKEEEESDSGSDFEVKREVDSYGDIDPRSVV